MEVLRVSEAKSENRMPGIVEAGALAISMFTPGHSSSAPARDTCDQISNIGGEIKSKISNIGGEIMSEICVMELLSDTFQGFDRCSKDLIGYLEKLIEITDNFVDCCENDEKKYAAFRQTLEVIKTMWMELKNKRIYRGFLIDKTKEFLDKASTMSESSSELARDLKKFKKDFPSINELYRTSPPPETCIVNKRISDCERKIEMAIRQRSIGPLSGAVTDLINAGFLFSAMHFDDQKDRYKAMKRILDIIEKMWKGLLEKPPIYPESVLCETKDFLDSAPNKLKVIEIEKVTEDELFWKDTTWSLKLSNDVTNFKSRNRNVVGHFQQLASTSSQR